MAGEVQVEGDILLSLHIFLDLLTFFSGVTVCQGRKGGRGGKREGKKESKGREGRSLKKQKIVESLVTQG